MSISVPLTFNATATIPDAIQGKKGDKGDKGDTGIQGIQGPTGGASLSVFRYLAPATIGSNLEAFALVVPTTATTYPLTTNTAVKFLSVVNKGSAVAVAGTFSVAPATSICLIRDPLDNSWIVV